MKKKLSNFLSAAGVLGKAVGKEAANKTAVVLKKGTKSIRERIAKKQIEKIAVLRERIAELQASTESANKTIAAIEKCARFLDITGESQGNIIRFFEYSDCGETLPHIPTIKLNEPTIVYEIAHLDLTRTIIPSGIYAIVKRNCLDNMKCDDVKEQRLFYVPSDENKEMFEAAWNRIYS